MFLRCLIAAGVLLLPHAADAQYSDEYADRVELVCDARAATLTARLMTESEIADRERRAMSAPRDPLIVRVYDDPSYDLHNSRIFDLMGDDEMVEAMEGESRNLLAFTKTPVRLFCSVEDENFFAAGDMTVDRSPGNINPMGRCGAAEVLTLEVTYNSEAPVMIDLIGDCHFAEEQVTEAILDLQTGEITRTAVPVGTIPE